MEIESKIKSYKDLIVWQKSYELTKLIYTLTMRLPKDEIYGLSSQIRRSAVSIPSNIAEGSHRKTRKDFGQFLHIAFGSVGEVETQLYLCRDLYNIDTSNALKLIEEISKMLRVFIKKLETNN